MADTMDTLAQAMKDLQGRFGDDAFADRRRLISLLSDRLPEARREIRAIGTAVDEGVPAALRGTQRELIGLEMDRQADRLENGTGLRADLARDTVRAIAFALDLGALPSIYPAASSAGARTPSAPAPQTDNNWVGASVPTGASSAPPSYAATSFYQPPQASIAIAPRAPMAGWMKAAIGIGAIIVLAILYTVLTKHPETANQGGVVAPGGVQPAPAGGGGQNPGGANDGYGGERHDFGIAPQATLQANVGSATPTSIPVGTTITTQQLQQMIAGSNPQLIDVLANPHATTIRGAIAMPEAGQPGTFDDATQAAVGATLQALPAARAGRPLVFFCVGVECWESYNAVLRANAAGLRNLYWYRGGLSAWQAAGGPFVPLPQATRQQDDDDSVP
jgi:PQQ-dependent catabolism-associated CXXCW motif protein